MKLRIRIAVLHVRAGRIGGRHGERNEGESVGQSEALVDTVERQLGSPAGVRT